LTENRGISVIIPTYNRPDSLLTLLKSLEDQTYKNFEVIVVVDGDRDTLEQIREYKAPYPLTIKYIENSGCFAARNIALSLVRTPLVAFTDDDCRPHPDWLEKGVKYFDDEKIVGIEGAIHSNTQDGIIYTSVQIMEPSPYIHGRTANMIYRTDVLKKVNGFDEVFLIESPRGKIGFRADTDLAWRVQKYGDISFAKDVVVFHPIRKNRISKEIIETRLYKNSALLLKKHPDRRMDVLRLTFKTRFIALPLLPFKLFWFLYGFFTLPKVKNRDQCQ